VRAVFIHFKNNKNSSFSQAEKQNDEDGSNFIQNM
jgi:hypothetical protein